MNEDQQSVPAAVQPQESWPPRGGPASLSVMTGGMFPANAKAHEVEDEAGSGILIWSGDGPPIYRSLVPQWLPKRGRSAAMGKTRITAWAVDGGQPFYVLSQTVPVQDSDDEIVGTSVKDGFVRRPRPDAIRVPATAGAVSDDRATTSFRSAHEPAPTRTHRSPAVKRLILSIRIPRENVGDGDPEPSG